MANKNYEGDPAVRRAPASLPLHEWAEIGLPSAVDKVLASSAPSSLSLGEWAKVGLPSAQAKVEKLTGGN